MRLTVEIELDDEEVQVLRDISRTSEPVRSMTGAWPQRAEHLERFRLVRITPVGLFVSYELTDAGRQALAQVK